MLKYIFFFFFGICVYVKFMFRNHNHTWYLCFNLYDDDDDDKLMACVSVYKCANGVYYIKY